MKRFIIIGILVAGLVLGVFSFADNPASHASRPSLSSIAPNSSSFFVLPAQACDTPDCG